MKKILNLSAFFLLVNIIVFQISNAESDYTIKTNNIVTRLKFLNNSIIMYNLLNNEVKDFIENNRNTISKSNLKKIANLYSILSDFIIAELSHNPKQKIYRKKLNSLIDSFNIDYQKLKKNETLDLNSYLEKQVVENRKRIEDEMRINKELYYANNNNSIKLITLEINKKSYNAMEGKIKLTGLKQKHRYQLSIVGYKNHPSNDILKKYYSSHGGLGYYDFKKVNSNQQGHISDSFKIILKPGTYKVKFLIKDIRDNWLAVFCENEVNFEVYPIQRANIKNTDIEIPIFLSESITIESVEFDISFNKNCANFSAKLDDPTYNISFPLNSTQPEILHFVVVPKKNNQVDAYEGVLFKFNMKLDISCNDSDIYITNSYINGNETNIISFFQNHEYTHTFFLRHK